VVFGLCSDLIDEVFFIPLNVNAGGGGGSDNIIVPFFFIADV
jgi:hypothetical protein